MSAEEWRPVAGFPDYKVSSLGRVLSYRAWRGNHGPRELLGSSNGIYRTVRMTAPSGDVLIRYVHHLVAEAFHGPRPAGQVIRHLDGDELNNAANNLLYGTPSENSFDTVRHGTNAWLHEDECRNGHRRTPENTRQLARQRICLDCRRGSQAAYRERRRDFARSAA